MGKLDKKALFSVYCGDEITAYSGRGFKKYSINRFLMAQPSEKVRSGNGKGAVCAGSMPLPVEMRPSSAPFRSASAEYASARRDETFAFSMIFQKVYFEFHRIEMRFSLRK